MRLTYRLPHRPPVRLLARLQHTLTPWGLVESFGVWHAGDHWVIQLHFKSRRNMGLCVVHDPRRDWEKAFRIYPDPPWYWQLLLWWWRTQEVYYWYLDRRWMYAKAQ